MKQHRIDLLHGNIVTVLTRLAVPIMATALVQTAYNLTDMAWIGVVGSDAVAAVGAAGMYTWLSTGVVMLAKMGGQVMVAQSIGQRKKERAIAFGRGAMQMTLILSILYGLVTVTFAAPLIGFFHLNSAEIAKEAQIYLRIACGLIIFPFFGQTITGLYTAAGNSRTPFIANCLGLLLNLIFDPVLILGVGPFPALGVAGAAIATVSAQAVVVLALVVAAVRGKDPIISQQLVIWKKIPGAYFGRMISYSGISILRNFHGSDPFCYLLGRCGSSGSASRGTDRVVVLDDRSGLRDRHQCLYGTELWCGKL